MLIGCEAFKKQTSIFFVTEIITNQIVFFTGETKTENITLLLKGENLTQKTKKRKDDYRTSRLLRRRWNCKFVDKFVADGISIFSSVTGQTFHKTQQRFNYSYNIQGICKFHRTRRLCSTMKLVVVDVP